MLLKNSSLGIDDHPMTEFGQAFEDGQQGPGIHELGIVLLTRFYPQGLFEMLNVQSP